MKLLFISSISLFFKLFFGFILNTCILNKVSGINQLMTDHYGTHLPSPPAPASSPATLSLSSGGGTTALVSDVVASVLASLARMDAARGLASQGFAVMVTVVMKVVSSVATDSMVPVSLWETSLFPRTDTVGAAVALITTYLHSFVASVVVMALR